MTTRLLRGFTMVAIASILSSPTLAAPPNPILSSWMVGVLTLLLLAIAALVIGWRRTNLRAPRRGAVEPAARLTLLSMLPQWLVLVPQRSDSARPLQSSAARHTGQTDSALARKRETITDR